MKDFHSRVETAVAALRAGGLVMLVDEADREDEGDLVVAAEFAEARHFTLMAERCRTLATLPMTGTRLDELGIPMMVERNTSRYTTPFTMSVDVLSGTTTGSSAVDRALTVRALLDPRTKLADFAVPGHVFPLRADADGVFGRMGHTEGAVDLLGIAGLYPAALISEAQGADGAMLHGAALRGLARECAAPLVAVTDIKLWRAEERVAE